MTLLETQSSPEYNDLNVMLAHLDIARIFCDQHEFYKMSSEHKIGGFRPVRDLLELFDTRMHLRFLWGAKGATVACADRYVKYEKILNVLSQKCEASQGPQKSIVKESSL